MTPRFALYGLHVMIAYLDGTRANQEDIFFYEGACSSANMLHFDFFYYFAVIVAQISTLASFALTLGSPCPPIFASTSPAC